MTKLSAMCVLKCLKTDQKRQRCQSSEQVWNFFGAIQMISCRDWRPWTKNGYITTTQKQSNIQWSGGIAAHPARPKNFRVQKSAGKVLVSIFWDQDGILLTDFLPKGQTINVQYCSSMLLQLKDILKEKRCGKFTKGVLFLYDNTHRTLAALKKLYYLGFQCLDKPLHFPDLAPSDHRLFPGLKKTIERSPFFVRR